MQICNFRLVDDEGRVLDLDTTSYALPTIDLAHVCKHMGIYYQVWGKAQISTDEHIIIFLNNPAGSGKEIHLKNEGGGIEGGGEISFYYGTSVDVNSLGTAFAPVNHKPSSSNTSVVSCYIDPVLVNTGTLIDPDQFGIGVKVGGGSLLGEEEHILAPGETAAVVLTSKADTNNCLIKSKWSELAPKS